MSRPTFERELQREQARQRRQREGSQHTDLSDRMDLDDTDVEDEYGEEMLRGIEAALQSQREERILQNMYNTYTVPDVILEGDDEQPEQLTQPSRPTPTPRLTATPPTQQPPPAQSSMSVGAGSSRTRDTSAFTTNDEEFQRMYAPSPQSSTSVGAGSSTPPDDQLAVMHRNLPDSLLTTAPSSIAGPSTSQDLGSYLDNLLTEANRLPTPLGGSPPDDGDDDDGEDNNCNNAEMRRTLERLREDENQRLQGRNIHAVTHTNTITTVYKDNRSPQTRRISTRTAGGRTVARARRGRGRGRGRGR